MLTLVVLQPFVAYIDCQDTIDASRSATSGSPGHRANLWTRVWHAFDDIVAHKTLAHASGQDVLSGRTTHRERMANGHADRLAKAGAAMCGLTPAIALEYRSLASLAWQAAKWAAEQAISQCRAGIQDAERLPDL